MLLVELSQRSMMAHFSSKLVLFSALLLWLGSTNVYGNSDDTIEEVTVEVEEEDLYKSPTVESMNVYLAEHFDDPAAFNKKWVKSEAKKVGVDDNIAKYDGKWEIQSPNRRILKDDLGLVLTTEAKHAAISALLDKPFEFREKPLIVQYEVTMQEGQNCGGAYIKLLSRGANTKSDLRKFYDQTPYTIMFGPDKCGNDNKLHFIFRHMNPINGTFEEKHSKKPSLRLEDLYKDKEPHLYTLVVRPDNTFVIFVDNKEANAGSLLEDFTPAVNPPEEIDDPNDRKPEDWDEREKIVDPAAQKPEDWDESAPEKIVDSTAVKPDGWLDDEPENIPDPTAQKPDDWDDDIDGEWEAPLIDNPACTNSAGCGPWSPPMITNPEYKGIWRAPLITNPNYKGKWVPRKIPNPHFFKDDHPFKMTSIHAVGFELWSMSPMLLFDNLIITDDLKVAEVWAKQTYAIKRAKLTKDSKSLWGRAMKAMNYKPGWWAGYFVYCLIPITIYICYLVTRMNEDSFVDRALKYAGDNPWMYAVVIVGTFIVVGIVAYLCCGPKSKQPETDSDYKKTDAVVEDDPHQSSDEGEGEEEEGEREEGEKEEPERPAERPSKQQLETDAPVDGAGDGQRKRKPRKE